MPDITMCNGDDCTKREACYRYTAMPHERQSYFVDPPFVFVADGIKCDHFWPEKNKIEELEQLVKKAYLEGAKDALYYGNSCQSDVCGFSEALWRNSDSKKELGGEQ